MWREEGGAEHPVGRSQSILKGMILTLLPTGPTGGGGASHTTAIKEIMWKPQPTGPTGGLSIQWLRALQTLTLARGGRGPGDLTHIYSPNNACVVGFLLLW